MDGTKESKWEQQKNSLAPEPLMTLTALRMDDGIFIWMVVCGPPGHHPSIIHTNCTEQLQKASGKAPPSQRSTIPISRATIQPSCQRRSSQSHPFVLDAPAPWEPMIPTSSIRPGGQTKQTDRAASLKIGDGR